METVGNYDIRLLDFARRLSDEHQCHVVVTLGRHGMVCAERDGATWYFPAVSTAARDVCGAGDTGFAPIAIAMLAGKSLRDVCRIAVVAACNQIVTIGIDLVPEL